MALRASSGPAPSVKSAKVGDVVEFRAKIENTAATAENVALVVEEPKDGHAPAFEPASIEIPPKGRTSVAFTWTAALPEGKPALTYRGKLVLRSASGALVGSAPLDLYVST